VLVALQRVFGASGLCCRCCCAVLGTAGRTSAHHRRHHRRYHHHRHHHHHHHCRYHRHHLPPPLNSYGLGTIDDIRGLAAIAQQAGVGMHVDSCLGGFIVNFVESVDSAYLAVPGVTSLSCDTHKNGWAPKGSSVCIMRSLPDSTFGAINLAYYAMCV
jgi:hypothetical protein